MGTRSILSPHPILPRDERGCGEEGVSLRLGKDPRKINLWAGPGPHTSFGSRLLSSVLRTHPRGWSAAALWEGGDASCKGHLVTPLTPFCFLSHHHSSLPVHSVHSLSLSQLFSSSFLPFSSLTTSHPSYFLLSSFFYSLSSHL